MINHGVLFVSPENKKGGIGAVLQLYKRYIPNFQIVYTYPDAKEKNKIIYFAIALYKIAKKLSLDDQIEIVHIHSASKGSFLRKSLVLLLAKAFSKIVVLHIHGGGFKEFYKFSKIRAKLILYILRKADKVICLTEEWHGYFSSGLGLQNVEVVANPIELPNIQERHKHIGVINMLFLGAIVKSKGIFDLLAYLSTNSYFINNKLHLHIGGEGDVIQLHSFLDRSQNKEGIVYHGWVDSGKKSELFQLADIFILPSYYEGLPMGVLEAMSYGKPIIATRVGGIPSVVKHGFNGWLYVPNNEKELDAIFEEIIQQPDLLQQYGANSRKEVSRFAIPNILNQLDEIYNSLTLEKT
jgi:glycosyltransferase involved in cell wall biosynthesis